MKEKVKELRLHIDGLAKLTSDITNINNAEIACCHHKLIMAKESLEFSKAWLGKLVGALGEPSPYKGGYKTKEDIEPVSSSKNIELSDKWKSLNHIEKLDKLREMIEETVQVITQLQFLPSQYEREAAIARTNAYTHLVEAKMWLGFALGAIRDRK